MATADKTIRFVVSAASGPAYISSMTPFQVRNLSGSYAPTNGSTSLMSVMPPQWTAMGGPGTNIFNPWSGGGKSITGTKMYAHGGGHNDGANNGVYSFDFNGTTRPIGWAVENAGQVGVAVDTSYPAVGETGVPFAVHTYDGMCDMGPSLYRFGGSAYGTPSAPPGASGGFTVISERYDKATSIWTRLPNWGASHSIAGMSLANPAVNKCLVMNRWIGYFEYGFYRAASNTWSGIGNVPAQWVTDGSAAFNPATNTALAVGGNNESGVFAQSFAIDWVNEMLSAQTARAVNIGMNVALIWDPTRSVYWCWGIRAYPTTLFEINPSNWSTTPHTLTGDVPFTWDSDYAGTLSRWVFMDSWRAIGSATHINAPAFVIRLP